MKNDQFMKGQFAVDTPQGEDGFMASCFPNLKVVSKREEFKKLNRLFQSQTAFMALEEEIAPFSGSELSLGELYSFRRTA